MNDSRFWLRTDVWFVTFTVLYVGLVFAGLGFQISLGSAGSPGHPLVNFLGLFVPYGLYSFLAASFTLEDAIGEAAFAVALLFPVMLWYLTHLFDKWLARMSFSAIAKIGCNLAILFALTIMADLVIIQEWSSLQIFLNSLS